MNKDFFLFYLSAAVLLLLVAKWLLAPARRILSKLHLPQLSTSQWLLVLAIVLLTANLLRPQPDRYRMVGSELPFVALDTVTGRLCAPFDQRKLDKFKTGPADELTTAAAFPPCGK